METAQSKFDEILNSESLEEVCSKINRLAKSKELDSSLILLINRAWAAAKESTSMKNEVCVKMSLYHWHVTLFLYLMGYIDSDSTLVISSKSAKMCYFSFLTEIEFLVCTQGYLQCILFHLIVA
jgi:hypothetical protein